MTDYILSPLARKDLREIQSYLEDLNPRVAARLITDLIEAFALLAERPGLGHLREDLTNAGIRFWTVQRRYSVAYRVSGDVTEIVRVFGPGRDIESLLSR